MLYHLATGQRPFGQPDNVRGLRRRLYIDPVPPRNLRHDCPAWLQELILHCLEVRPERRYQTAAQLALDLQDPGAVTLSARAERRNTTSLVTALKRWFFRLGAEPARDRSPVTARLARSPILMAAVDVDNAAAPLLATLQETVQRVLHTEPGARLACVSVMRVSRIGMDDLVDGDGRSRHVGQLVALKHWARPIGRSLRLDEGRITFHVLEAADAAAALIEFAQRNQVDHIVMGARGASSLRRLLGSVSSQVVAQSSCTVTVVRAARAADPANDEASPAPSAVPPAEPAATPGQTGQPG
jgi:protein-serine/threonine kinase